MFDGYSKQFGHVFLLHFSSNSFSLCHTKMSVRDSLGITAVEVGTLEPISSSVLLYHQNLTQSFTPSSYNMFTDLLNKCKY